jgi:hypothetical protein
MVVGSNHLANSNRDMVNLPVEDVLTSRRQREIQDVVDGLAQWRPTRIAVEWPHDDETGLDRRYAEYRAGRLERTASELDQIALRLAKKLGLSKVHAVDWNHEGPGDPADYDFTEWARTNGDGHRLQNLIEREQGEAERTASSMRHQTVSEWLRNLNSPEARLKMHQPYFLLATFGSSERHPGAAWVGRMVCPQPADLS